MAHLAEARREAILVKLGGVSSCRGQKSQINAAKYKKRKKGH